MSAGWISVEVAGKKVEVFDPLGLARPRFGVLFLHGYGLETLNESPAFTRVLGELNLACLCPHGGRCWWTDRVCAEFDPKVTNERYIVDAIVPFFQQRWVLTPPSIGLLGISMGGQGALRLAFKHPGLFPVVAGISSALDYHELYGQGMVIDSMYTSKEQCRQDSALLHVPPSNYPAFIYFCIDPADTRWYRGNDRLHEKLTALGIEHEVDLTTRSGGHSWEYFDHMAQPALRFIQSGLEQQSRRLV